eukprot:g19943.t1
MMLTAQEVAPLYQTDFVRNARAVTALWAVCTLCLALLEVVVLTEPAWVQAPASGPGPTGTFGLFQLCQQTDGPPRCQGSLAALSPVPSFQTPAGFVGAALGLVLASVCCSLGLYRCCSPSTVYKVCAWLQFSAASSLASHGSGPKSLGRKGSGSNLGLFGVIASYVTCCGSESKSLGRKGPGSNLGLFGVIASYVTCCGTGPKSLGRKGPG